MRLFLVAALPLVLSVPVQMSIGLNKIKVIALAALAGSLVNLPISCYLTARLGVVGRDLGHRADDALLEPAGARHLRLPRAGDRPADLPEADPERAAGRRRRAGRGHLGPAVADAGRRPRPAAGLAHDAARSLHLAAGTVAYLAGYLLVPAGRGDLAELAARLRRR